MNNLVYVHNTSFVELTSPNTKRDFFKQIGLVLGLCLLFLDTLFGLSADSWQEFLIPGDMSVAIVYWGAHFFVVACLFLWKVTPPNRLLFDWTRKEVLLMFGKEQVRFPWSSVRFRSQWIPTKLGGIQLLTIKAGPPLPDNVLKRFAKHMAKNGDREVFVPLGGFGCKNGDIVDAYIQFFDALMERDEQPERLFRQTVGAKI